MYNYLLGVLSLYFLGGWSREMGEFVGEGFGIWFGKIQVLTFLPSWGLSS